MAEKIIKGKVGAVKEGKLSPSGWMPYYVTLTNGTAVVVSLPPDVVSSGLRPEIGKDYTFLLAKYDKYLIEPAVEDTPPREAAAEPSGISKPYVNNKDAYWAAKDEYDQKVMHPKIEFQFYFKTVMDAYIAALPYLEVECPKTIDGVDDYINQAFDKATALYETINKK